MLIVVPARGWCGFPRLRRILGMLLLSLLRGVLILLRIGLVAVWLLVRMGLFRLPLLLRYVLMRALRGVVALLRPRIFAWLRIGLLRCVSLRLLDLPNLLSRCEARYLRQSGGTYVSACLGRASNVLLIHNPRWIGHDSRARPQHAYVGGGLACME